jgi:hypothetical protein
VGVQKVFVTDVSRRNARAATEARLACPLCEARLLLQVHPSCTVRMAKEALGAAENFLALISLD